MEIEEAREEALRAIKRANLPDSIEIKINPKGDRIELIGETKGINSERKFWTAVSTGLQREQIRMAVINFIKKTREKFSNSYTNGLLWR